MNNNEETAPEKGAISLESIPFNSKGPQYYTAHNENEASHIAQEQSQGQSQITMNESLLEINSADMSMRDTSRWRSGALAISLVSIIVLLVLGVLSFVVSDVTNSSAAFGFGFDCLLDVGTSIVVLWRFMGSLGSVYSAEKERIALLFLGSLFIIAAVSIFARAIPDLINSTETSGGFWLMILASVSMVICTGLAITKFIIAKKLDSKSVLSDGYSSLAGAITALSMLISAIVIHYEVQVWYLDEIIGIVVGLLLAFYGIKTLVEVTQSMEMRVSLKSCWSKNKN